MPLDQLKSFIKYVERTHIQTHQLYSPLHVGYDLLPSEMSSVRSEEFKI